MAFSKVNANWTGVSHANTTITRVTQVSFSQGGSLQEFAGDNDRFPTLLCNLMSKPTASVQSADVGLLMGIASGTEGSFLATNKDAKGLANGDIAFTLANAVAENVSFSDGFGGFSSATLNLRSYSSDGITNPLSFTQTRS